MDVIDGRKTYTAKEAGEIIGRTPFMIRNLVNNGKLDAKKVNGRLCIYADSLKDYANSMDYKTTD